MTLQDVPYHVLSRLSGMKYIHAGYVRVSIETALHENNLSASEDQVEAIEARVTTALKTMFDIHQRNT